MVRLTHAIRNYDYSAITILGVCHDVRWFSGAAGGDVDLQKRILKYFLDTTLKANATRGREDRNPLVYKEVLELAKRACHSMNVFEDRYTINQN